MKSKLTLSLLLVMTAFQAPRSWGQAKERPAAKKDAVPKKAVKKRKTRDEIRDERYEKALGWASKKEADRRRRAEALEAGTAPTRGELILQGQTRFSYREWVGGYHPKIELAPFFPASGEPPIAGEPPAVAEPPTGLPLPDSVALGKEWAEALPRYQKLREHTAANTASPRGELDDPILRERVADLYRVSLLRLRLSGTGQISAWLHTEGDTWMRAWTAIAFDEATPEAIRFVSAQRQAFARELLAKRRALPAEFPDEDVAHVLREARWPWPIDRAFMTEARKSLKPGAQLVANGLAGDLQKQPGRSLAELRRVRRGGDLPGLAELDHVYTAEDVKLRQREEDLFHELRLRCELGRYQRARGGAAKSLEDLVNAGFLDRIPTHHASGKPWAITQLQQ